MLAQLAVQFRPDHRDRLVEKDGDLGQGLALTTTPRASLQYATHLATSATDVEPAGTLYSSSMSP